MSFVDKLIMLNAKNGFEAYVRSIVLSEVRSRGGTDEAFEDVVRDIERSSLSLDFISDDTVVWLNMFEDYIYDINDVVVDAVVNEDARSVFDLLPQLDVRDQLFVEPYSKIVVAKFAFAQTAINLADIVGFYDGKKID